MRRLIATVALATACTAIGVAIGADNAVQRHTGCYEDELTYVTPEGIRCLPIDLLTERVNAGATPSEVLADSGRLADNG